MNRMFGQNCLTLTLLALSLAATLSIGSSTRRDAATAHVASMQLQSYAEEDDAATTPDTADGEKAASCTPHERHCLASKQEIVLVSSDDRPAHESKAFAAPSDEIPAKYRY